MPEEFFSDIALEVQQIRNHAYLTAGVTEIQRGRYAEPEGIRIVRELLEEIADG